MAMISLTENQYRNLIDRDIVFENIKRNTAIQIVNEKRKSIISKKKIKVESDTDV